MAYKDEILTFETNKIYYSNSDITLEVMMDWESSVMEASADYVCSNGGDILELGFGMGISTGYIQENFSMIHTEKKIGVNLEAL